MNRLTISPNWTDQERLQVINRLSLKLSSDGGFVYADYVNNIAYIINLVSSAPAELLELNRENILEGFDNEPT